ncbi:hypothetical protein PNH38_08000 [Anoxybacillus rupiensis]|uniref:Uncharacterized protein n=1 Tax=Anoxybacteroides rupiense TaxID=311460 RepID=A0ABT5W3C2_9BACL|nr:hypothetical protein [Anoxybacillus rupiensis]
MSRKHLRFSLVACTVRRIKTQLRFRFSVQTQGEDRHLLNVIHS